MNIDPARVKFRFGENFKVGMELDMTDDTVTATGHEEGGPDWEELSKHPHAFNAAVQMQNHSIDTAKLVKVYVKMRDARAAKKKAFEAEDRRIGDQQDQIENELLRFLNDNTMESVRTSHGTFYRKEEVVPNGSDWDAFYAWVKENDAFDAFERRIKATFVKTFMEEHAGGLPPGVSVHRRFKAGVRRS